MALMTEVETVRRCRCLTRSESCSARFSSRARFEPMWEEELEQGDAFIADNLACHHSLESRRFFKRNDIIQLPIPPKIAPDRITPTLTRTGRSSERSWEF